MALPRLALSMGVQSNDTKDKLKTAGGRYGRKGSLVKFSLIFLLLLTVPVAWRWTDSQRVDQLRYGHRLATIDKEPPGGVLSRCWRLCTGRLWFFSP